MTDYERAEWLARAVDKMLHGITQDDATGALDEESSDLLDIARLRRDTGESARQLAREHEETVWKELLTRVNVRIASDGAPAAPHSGWSRTEAAVASLRRGGPLAIPHRQAAWGYTLQGEPEPDSARGVEYPATGDPEFDSLVRAALAGSPQLTERGSQGLQTAVAMEKTESGTFRLITPRFLALAGGVALILGAIGPLPATGLADHPAVNAVEYLAEHAGVIEADSLAPPGDEGILVNGIDVEPDEAPLLLGQPVSIPEVPAGFALSGSRYYPVGITASVGGVFALTYSNAETDASLNIYQEADAGAKLVVLSGSAKDVSVGSSPATYFEGTWESSDHAVTWGSPDTQTLVFSNVDVRVIVVYAGAPVPVDTLSVLAASMIR